MKSPAGGPGLGSFSCVGLGEVLWDVFPGGRELGGAPANFAYHAGALGARASVVSAVGADAEGADLLARLRAMGLDAQGVGIAPAHRTGRVDVELDADGKPRYVIHADVAWDFISFGPALHPLAASAHAVCYGTLARRSPVSRAGVEAFLDATPPSCLRIYDINLRQDFYSREIIDAGLRRARIAKLNGEELPVVAELLGLRGDTDGQLRALIARYGLAAVALTRGEKGSILRTAGERSEIGEAPVEVVDTVGAGDAFTAALAAGLLLGRPLAQVHARAARLAGFVCTRRGATPPMPPALRVL